MNAAESAPRVLVVEDEEAIAQGLRLNLTRKGYEVEVAGDGAEALARARAERWDLILLDVRLPGLDGFEICRRLRDAGDLTPILMLTARSQPDDVVYGLKLGADDYVVKPFDRAELLARVEGLLRRRAWAHGARPATGPEEAHGPEGSAASRPEGSTGVEETAAAPADGAAPRAGRYVFGDFWIDFDSWMAKTRQGVVELSMKEIAVMKVFTARPGQVIARRELLAEVWQLPHHPNTRVVDNVILSLRRAFEENSWRPRHIHSVRGIGYRFEG